MEIQNSAMNTIKRIWNYFFEKKKVETKDYGCMPISVPPLENCGHPVGGAIKSKVIEQKIILPKYSHKMQFNKQQLIGKIYNIGKDRFKIHERISVADKFKYHIEVLI